MIDPDRFLERILQRAALRVHNAEQRWEALIMGALPPWPQDERDERDVRGCLAAARAHRDQVDAARADRDEARAAYADAYRLATGRGDLCPDGAAVMAYATATNGAAAVVAAHHPPASPARPAPALAAARTGNRARGAGRPRAQATRSGARSGDSGDDDGGEPPEPSPADAGRRGRLRLRYTQIDAADEAIRWTFAGEMGDNRVFVHAISGIADVQARGVWHTHVNGLVPCELAELAPEDYTIGMPAGVDLADLEDAIAVEQARLDLAVQLTLVLHERSARRWAA